MKKLSVLLLCVALAASLLACGAPSVVDTPETTTQPQDQTYEFSLGFSAQLPEGFREQQSKRNDFYGTGDDGAYGIIANRESKEGFENLQAYAQSVAEANQAGEVSLNEYGKFYIAYESDGNQLYTVFAEGDEAFYRVVFYCPLANWDHYRDSFPQWAAAVTVQ